jgi:hypothetical protein
MEGVMIHEVGEGGDDTRTDERRRARRRRTDVAAVHPELVSQLNVEAATGIGARVYLDTIRVPGFPVKVVKFGKLRIVDRAEFVAWVRKRGEESDSGVDAVLREVGATRRG